MSVCLVVRKYTRHLSKLEQHTYPRTSDESIGRSLKNVVAKSAQRSAFIVVSHVHGPIVSAFESPWRRNTTDNRWSLRSCRLCFTPCTCYSLEAATASRGTQTSGIDFIGLRGLWEVESPGIQVCKLFLYRHFLCPYFSMVLEHQSPESCWLWLSHFYGHVSRI